MAQRVFVQHHVFSQSSIAPITAHLRVAQHSKSHSIGIFWLHDRYHSVEFKLLHGLDAYNISLIFMQSKKFFLLITTQLYHLKHQVFSSDFVEITWKEKCEENVRNVKETQDDKTFLKQL